MHVCVRAQNTSEPCGVKFQLVKKKHIKRRFIIFFFSLSSLSLEFGIKTMSFHLELGGNYGYYVLSLIITAKANSLFI
jgi:hypothetical protein